MYYRAGSAYYGQFYLVSVVYSTYICTMYHVPGLSIENMAIFKGSLCLLDWNTRLTFDLKIPI